MFLLFVDILSISMNYFCLSGYRLGDSGAGAGTTYCESWQVSLLLASSSRMSWIFWVIVFLDLHQWFNLFELADVASNVLLFPESCYHSSFYLNNFVEWRVELGGELIPFLLTDEDSVTNGYFWYLCMSSLVCMLLHLLFVWKSLTRTLESL